MAQCVRLLMLEECFATARGSGIGRRSILKAGRFRRLRVVPIAARIYFLRNFSTVHYLHQLSVTSYRSSFRESIPPPRDPPHEHREQHNTREAIITRVKRPSTPHPTQSPSEPTRRTPTPGESIPTQFASDINEVLRRLKKVRWVGWG